MFSGLRLGQRPYCPAYGVRVNCRFGRTDRPPSDAEGPANSADAVLGALARRCGAANLGAFIALGTPPNISADYEAQLNALRAGLRERLRTVFGIEVR